MKGFSVEPGERSALRHIHFTGTTGVEISWRADMRQHFAGRIVGGENGERDIRTERCRKRARALARQVFEALLQVGVDGEPKLALGRRCRDRRVGGMRRQHRHETARLGYRSPPWQARSRRPAPRRFAQTGRARGFSPRARLPGSDRDGATPAIAAKRPEVPLPRAKDAAAPCRNRPVKRRGCPRDCRHRVQVRDKATAPDPSSRRARSRLRVPSGEIFPQDRGRDAPSSRRATCIVNVEAPERMWPLLAN